MIRDRYGSSVKTGAKTPKNFPMSLLSDEDLIDLLLKFPALEEVYVSKEAPETWEKAFTDRRVYLRKNEVYF